MANLAAVFCKHFADPSVFLEKVNKYKKPAGLPPTTADNYSVIHNSHVFTTGINRDSWQKYNEILISIND